MKPCQIAGFTRNLVETAMLRAAPEQSYKIQFVNDWSSHLDLLMPTLAFDGDIPVVAAKLRRSC